VPTVVDDVGVDALLGKDDVCREGAWAAEFEIGVSFVVLIVADEVQDERVCLLVLIYSVGTAEIAKTTKFFGASSKARAIP
jgi:hypothetical protein